MAYKNPPIRVVDGGTGSTTAAGARTNLAVPLNTNTMLLDGTQAMTANMDLGSNKIVNVATPTSANDAANKAYVDAKIGNGITTIARVATVGSNITLAGGAPSTLDGVTLVANDIVLVKDQSTGAENGLYSIQTLGTGSNGTWVRATGFTTSGNFSQTILVYVDLGTQNGSTGWIWAEDPDNPPTLGSTTITFSQFTGLGDVTAGNGLTKSGNTISVLANGTTINVSGAGIKVSDTYPGNTSLNILGTVATGTWQATKVDIPYGGTNATTAAGARANLSAAPNTAKYWVGDSSLSSELANEIIPSGGTGITLNATAGTVAVDTSVVWTTSNTIAATNKTLTSPIITTPDIRRGVSIKTGNYTLAATDDFIKFNISSGATATLTASGSMTTGHNFTIKNAAGSSANVTVQTNGSDKLENSTSGTFTLYPGDAIDVIWDGVEYSIY